MPIITSTDEAEEAAKQWMKLKYPGKLGKVKFSQVMLQKGIWSLNADVQVRTGVLEMKRRSLVVRIEAESANVIGYSEGPPL